MKKPQHIIIALLATALVGVFAFDSLPRGVSSSPGSGAPAAAGSSTAPAAPRKPPSRPLATSEGAASGLKAELVDLHRSGPKVVSARFRIKFEPPPTQDADHWLAITGAPLDYGNGAEMRLIDEVNGREHLPLADQRGNCLCSGRIHMVEKGEIVGASAKFPAPPEDVDRVSLHVPGFQSFDGIPLS